jgi:hypothetical protein
MASSATAAREVAAAGASSAAEGDPAAGGDAQPVLPDSNGTQGAGTVLPGRPRRRRRRLGSIPPTAAGSVAGALDAVCRLKLERSVEPVPVSWERERRRGMEHFSEGVFEYEMIPQPYDDLVAAVAPAAAGRMGTTKTGGADGGGGEEDAADKRRTQRHRRRVIRIAESFEEIGHRVRVGLLSLSVSGFVCFSSCALVFASHTIAFACRGWLAGFLLLQLLPPPPPAAAAGCSSSGLGCGRVHGALLRAPPGVRLGQAHRGVWRAFTLFRTK